MQCPTCFGHRLFYYHGVYLPCPDCEGHGVIHCCDGLQAQPDQARDEGPVLVGYVDRRCDAPTAAAG